MLAEEEGGIERVAGEGRRRQEEHVHGGVASSTAQGRVRRWE